TPRAAEARGSSGHGGGGGHSVGSSHSGGASHSRGGSRVSSHGGSSHVGGVRGGGSWHTGGHRRGGWGYYPYGWGWGWWPYYSSWWWGGSNVYVVAGGDGDGEGDGSVGASARTGRYAIVRTDVSPEEAQIFLDGKYIGTADDFDGRPDYLYLGPGKYHLEFHLPGYQMLATDLDVSRGQRVRLDQKLKLEPGKSALDQFAPESKGTPLGRVFTKGGSEAEEEAPPAPRRVPQRAPRDDGWSDRERMPEQRVPEERMDVRPERLPRPAGNRARMRFKVTPEDAAVYVDDKYLGAGEDLAANPRGVVTDPGTHSITVTRPGYKSKTVDITVRIGAPVDVVVELEK
ncbi:MAG: PEGA domain-containing protein, partial [Thermoanaerobaculia bacterium]